MSGESRYMSRRVCRTMNLTQWREGAKMRLLRGYFRFFAPVIPALSLVIPAKAGIQRADAVGGGSGGRPAGGAALAP